jgi:hypothetical protein
VRLHKHSWRPLRPQETSNSEVSDSLSATGSLSISRVGSVEPNSLYPINAHMGARGFLGEHMLLAASVGPMLRIHPMYLSHRSSDYGNCVYTGGWLTANLWL